FLAGRNGRLREHAAHDGTSVRARCARTQSFYLLAQERVYHVAMHVGEAEVAALEAVGQPRVLDAEAVQDGRVEVVDRHRVFGNVVAVVVGRPVADAGL